MARSAVLIALGLFLAGCHPIGPPPGTPPGHGGVPPGHGGIPPGQAKKMDDR